MLRHLCLGLISLVVIAGCKGKQQQSDVSGSGAAPGIDSSSLSFDPMGSDSGKITGLKTIYFGYDRAALDEGSRSDLQANADWMKANSSVRIQIEGHCDNRGTIEYNVALGERRANAVRTYMMGLGISGDRLSIISYGEEKPLVMGDGEESFSKNRRANFVPVQ